MSSPAVTFYNGTHTVGGVQILLEGQTGRIVFDLGVVDNPRIARSATLFNQVQSTRRDHELRDMLCAGMAPPIEGLYAAELLGTSVANVTAPYRMPGRHLSSLPVATGDLHDTTAVFISHLHPDHAALLPLVAPDVRVLMSQAGRALHEALVSVARIRPSGGSVEGIAPGQATTVGDLSVELSPVDHDVPGSSGIIIEIDGMVLAYTGDWRLHGSHPDRMEAFAQRCATRHVDILVTEGSTLTASEPQYVGPQHAETDVAGWVAARLKDTNGTAFLTLHPYNVDRLVTVADVAEAHGRTLVLDPRTAATWSALACAGEVPPPGAGVATWASPTEPTIRLTGLPTVTVADIAADRPRFVVEVVRGAWPLLLDVGAGPGDAFLHLNGDPYGPADPAWEALRTWCHELRVDLQVFSAHGHASAQDLAWLVEAVRPAAVVPVHSNHPECFPRTSSPVWLPQRGQRVSLAELARLAKKVDRR